MSRSPGKKIRTERFKLKSGKVVELELRFLDDGQFYMQVEQTATATRSSKTCEPKSCRCWKRSTPSRGARSFSFITASPARMVSTGSMATTSTRPTSPSASTQDGYRPSL